MIDRLDSFSAIKERLRYDSVFWIYEFMQTNKRQII